MDELQALSARRRELETALEETKQSIRALRPETPRWLTDGLAEELRKSLNRDSSFDIRRARRLLTIHSDWTRGRVILTGDEPSEYFGE